ncbi:MAG TPA: hypothetical protein VEP67_01015 [Thiobacillaceae bacterium]|nr:hypothetical protein [Thiobacillaceae bacterium]
MKSRSPVAEWASFLKSAMLITDFVREPSMLPENGSNLKPLVGAVCGGEEAA